MPKKILIILAIILTVALVCATIIALDQKNLFEDYSALEVEFGKLEPYMPKQVFVHFKTEDGDELFCLKNKNGSYTYLDKFKIKE